MKEQLHLDPAQHWMTSQDHTWNSVGRPTVTAIPFEQEIRDKRSSLDGSDSDPAASTLRVPAVRALVIASVLRECAERLRLQTGDAAAPPALAELADELASDLQQRCGIGI